MIIRRVLYSFGCISPGIWKLVAWHQNSPQQNFSSEFEVKEYGRCICDISVTSRDIRTQSHVPPSPPAVLPSFEVSLTPHKAFFHINDDGLSVDINAKYGTQVIHIVHVTFLYE